MKKYFLSILILLIATAVTFSIFKYRLNNGEQEIQKNLPATYEEIFAYDKFLTGKEETAKEVADKLDLQLKRNRAKFIKIAGTKDNKELRVLFYMNFVSFYGYYYERDLPEKKTFKHLMWNTRFNNCGSSTMILAMLLDRAGYSYRTVAINNMSHGYIEVKLPNGWHVLDPTTNIWINRGTEDLMAKKPASVKSFYLRAENANDQKARMHLERGFDVLKLRENMQKIGNGFDAKVDKYNYIDLKVWKY